MCDLICCIALQVKELKLRQQNWLKQRTQSLETDSSVGAMLVVSITSWEDNNRLDCKLTRDARIPFFNIRILSVSVKNYPYPYPFKHGNYYPYPIRIRENYVYPQNIYPQIHIRASLKLTVWWIMRELNVWLKIKSLMKSCTGGSRVWTHPLDSKATHRICAELMRICWVEPVHSVKSPTALKSWITNCSKDDQNLLRFARVCCCSSGNQTTLLHCATLTDITLQLIYCAYHDTTGNPPGYCYYTINAQISTTNI